MGDDGPTTLTGHREYSVAVTEGRDTSHEGIPRSGGGYGERPARRSVADRTSGAAARTAPPERPLPARRRGTGGGRPGEKSSRPVTRTWWRFDQAGVETEIGSSRREPRAAGVQGGIHRAACPGSQRVVRATRRRTAPPRARPRPRKQGHLPRGVRRLHAQCHPGRPGPQRCPPEAVRTRPLPGARAVDPQGAVRPGRGALHVLRRRRDQRRPRDSAQSRRTARLGQRGGRLPPLQPRQGGPAPAGSAGGCTSNPPRPRAWPGGSSARDTATRAGCRTCNRSARTTPWPGSTAFQPERSGPSSSPGGTGPDRYSVPATA